MSLLDSLRASDEEREQTAKLLRDHCADGRITPEELSDRLDGVYAARTIGELDLLVDDLPAYRARPAPPPDLARARAKARVLQTLGTMTLISLVCIVIWLATGADGSFWPRWVIVACAIRLVSVAWSELGPGARHDEARLGRGGSTEIERK